MQNNNLKDLYTDRFLTKQLALQKDDSQLAFLKHFVPKDKTSTILDAGCGDGKYSMYLAKAGYENLTAVDIIDQEFEGFNYKSASIESLPFPDEHFDFIYCFSVIFHLKDPMDGLKEFSRVAKKGSMLVLTAHTRYSLFTLWRKIKLKFKVKDVMQLENAHFISSVKYKKMLRSQGFRTVHMDGFKMSFLLYYYYRRKKDGLKKIIPFEPPVIMPRVSKISFFAWWKSILGYHSVLVAIKE